MGRPPGQGATLARHGASQLCVHKQDTAVYSHGVLGPFVMAAHLSVLTRRMLHETLSSWKSVYCWKDASFINSHLVPHVNRT